MARFSPSDVGRIDKTGRGSGVHQLGQQYWPTLPWQIL